MHPIQSLSLNDYLSQWMKALNIPLKMIFDDFLINFIIFREYKFFKTIVTIFYLLNLKEKGDEMHK